MGKSFGMFSFLFLISSAIKYTSVVTYSAADSWSAISALNMIKLISKIALVLVIGFSSLSLAAVQSPKLLRSSLGGNTFRLFTIACIWDEQASIVLPILISISFVVLAFLFLGLK